MLLRITPSSHSTSATGVLIRTWPSAAGPTWARVSTRRTSDRTCLQIQDAACNLRGDQQVGAQDSLWFRFSRVSLPRRFTNPIGGAQGTDVWRARNMGAN